MSTPSGPSEDPTPRYPSYPGQAGPAPTGPPPSGQAPPSGLMSSSGPTTPRGRRPVTVTSAAWTTIVLSALSIVSGIAFAIAAAPISDYVRDHPRELDLSSSELDQLDNLRTGLVALSVLMVLAATTAVVVAALVLKRQAWARTVLVVLSALTIVVGLLFTVAAVVGLPWFAGGIAVVVLLFTGGANEWFAPETPQASAPPEVP